MAENKKSKKDGIIKGVAVTGLAIAAVAVGYFLYGPEGDKNRKKLKGWMLKMKGEVIEKIEKAKEVNRETYNKIIDQVSDKYKKMKSVSEEEVEKLSKRLKAHWPKIEKSNPKKSTKKK
ncbi:MAG: hypothetical protein WBK67_03550 [Minisyncoccales bacterium]|jgi:hypothetical protein